MGMLDTQVGFGELKLQALGVSRSPPKFNREPQSGNPNSDPDPKTLHLKPQPTSWVAVEVWRR